MDTHSRRVAENRRLEDLLESGARERLLAVPGVLHVAVGLRQVAGRATDELCFKTWVQRKADPGDLAPADLVPREVAGVRTDVSQMPKVEFSVSREQALINRSRHRPVVGGIQISNGYLDIHPENGTLLNPGGGTLGCFATRVKDGKKVLLTCWHVALANQGAENALLYQPAADLDVAHIDDVYPKKPSSTAHRIARIVGHEISEKVDAAIAEVCSCHILCLNLGVGFRNRILGLNVNGGDTVEGVSTSLVNQDSVWKVGRMTGRTEGKVVTTDYPPFSVPRFGVERRFTGQIQIEGVGENFAENGDSGSVVVDAHRKVVGLYFVRAVDEKTGQVYSIANHIADVTTALGITITGSERSLNAEPEPFAQRLRATDTGSRLTALAAAHHDELHALINDERRVTVAWHRAQGPAWTAALLRSTRHPGYLLPDHIEGVTRAEALTRLRDALDRHGSPALRADLARWYGPLLTAFTRSPTTDALLDSVGGPA